jgi:hypothetical protein
VIRPEQVFDFARKPVVGCYFLAFRDSGFRRFEEIINLRPYFRFIIQQSSARMPRARPGRALGGLAE